MKKFKEFIKEKSDSIICFSAFMGMVVMLVWLNNTNQCISDIDMPTTTETTTVEITTVEITTAAVEENTTLNVEAPAPSEPETIIKTIIRYDVPLDDNLQKYVIDICAKKGVAPSLIFAIMERESNFNPNCVGDSGNSLGIMQIQPKWHQWRADKLGCLDWFNPYDNATVGIDIVAGLFEKYGDDVYMVLMAYNGGSSYANRLSSNGKISDYAIKVNARAEELDRTMQAIEETIILN